MSPSEPPPPEARKPREVETVRATDAEVTAAEGVCVAARVAPESAEVPISVVGYGTFEECRATAIAFAKNHDATYGVFRLVRTFTKETS